MTYDEATKNLEGDALATFDEQQDIRSDAAYDELAEYALRDDLSEGEREAAADEMSDLLREDVERDVAEIVDEAVCAIVSYRPENSYRGISRDVYSGPMVIES